MDESEIDADRLYADRAPGVVVNSGGAFAELNVGKLYGYLEVDAQQHEKLRQQYSPPDWISERLMESGQAVFGEISYDLSPVGIKAEGFWYRRWLMEGPPRGPVNEYTLSRPVAYSQLVTFEPRWLPTGSLGNELGGKLTADTLLTRTDTQVALSTAVLEYLGAWTREGDWSKNADVFIVHPKLEIRQGLPGSAAWIATNGGYRREVATKQQSDPGSLWHVGLSVSVPLSGPHSVNAEGELRRHALIITDRPNPYWIALVSLRYDWASRFSTGIVYEYSDQNQGERNSIGAWELPIPRQNYLWGVISSQLQAPGGSLVLRLSGGSQRGGVKCAGGVCREYPDSVGTRFEATYRY
jgi:hypothetical protein